MAEEKKEGEESVRTDDVKIILDSYDCYSSGKLGIPNISNIPDKENWKFDQMSDVGNKRTSMTNIIDIDQYWNFYNVVAPKVDVEFLVGYKKDEKGNFIRDTENNKIKDWVNINYNSYSKKNNYNNYFVSANIIDKGVKELELVLYDRNFTNIQRLISASISFVDTSLSSDDSDDGDLFNKSVKNGADLTFFTQPSNISSNLRIRYGYNENKDLTVKKNYKGLYKNDTDGKYRWRTAEYDKKVTEEGVDVDDDALAEQWQQSTLFSTWDEFFITGLTSTLTETGIKYTIKGVSVDRFALDGYKMKQQYSKLVGKPKTVMATLMDMFNKKNEKGKTAPIKLVWVDDSIRASDSAINGKTVLMNYKTGNYQNVEEEGENGIEEIAKKIKTPIESLSKEVKMLKDILACFTNIQDNHLNDYSYGYSVDYNANIGIILDRGLSVQANIVEKKSYLDFAAWPFDNGKLENLTIDTNYTSSLKKMAAFQRKLSIAYGDIIKFMSNKEDWFDTKTSCTTRSLLKVWLANIAIEAYGIVDDSGGKLGDYGKNLEANKKAKNDLESAISQLDESFANQKKFPIYWVWNNSSYDKSRRYIPGDEDADDGNDYLRGQSAGSRIKFSDLNGEIGNGWVLDNLTNYKPGNMKNIIKSLDMSAPIMMDYLTVKKYQEMKILGCNGENVYKEIMNRIFDSKAFFNEGEGIFLETNFFNEETNEDVPYSLASISREASEGESDFSNSNKKLCDKISDKFNKIEEDRNIVSQLSSKKFIKFVRKNGKGNWKNEKIFYASSAGKYVTDFNINGISVDDSEEGHIYIISGDKETAFDFETSSKSNEAVWTTSDTTCGDMIKKFITEIIELGLDLINKKAMTIKDENGTTLYFMCEASLKTKEDKLIKNNSKNTYPMLDEIKNNINIIKQKLLEERSNLNLDNLYSKMDTSSDDLNKSSEDMKELGKLKEVFSNEITEISKSPLNYDLIDIYIDENNTTKKFGTRKNNGNFLLDAFKLIQDESTSKSTFEAFAKELKDEIEIENEKLSALIEKQAKIDSSNIGKEIELSLGTQESLNPNLKLTKTISSLLNDFCSQCQPKQFADAAEMDSKELTVRDGNGDSKRINVYSNMPKYNLTWGIVGHYQVGSKNQKGSPEIPIVGLYYKEPKPVKILRMYNWGTGNPKAHCIKSLSIANSTEFAMMHNFATATETETGIQSTINSDGGKLEIKDFMPTKDPCFFSQSFDSDRDANIFNNMVNSLAKGTVTLLGDPSLKFGGMVQPYTYPIYINIKLQSENRTWTSRENSGNVAPISQLSGYYIVTQITHNISSSGYTTTLEVMKYPGSSDSAANSLNMDKYRTNSKDFDNSKYDVQGVSV